MSSSLPPRSLPFSFLETFVALRNAHGKKKVGRRRLTRNMQKNGAKKPSPFTYLRKREQQSGEGALIREGRTMEQKILSLSHLMQIRHALTDETCPV